MRGSDRNRYLSDSIVLAILSGILLGLAGFCLKIVMSGELSMAIIFSPYAWIALLLAVGGFLLMQKSFQGYVSRAIPIINGFLIIVSVALAYVFLGETLSGIKMLGTFFVLIGVFGLVSAGER